MHRYVKLYRGERQNGWECFDIALNTSRQDLYEHAISHSGDEVYRGLLAPEIRHAAALTAIHANSQEEEQEKIEEQVASLLAWIEKEEGKEYAEEVAAAIEALLSGNGEVPEQDLLPEELREQAVPIMNALMDAPENLRRVIEAGKEEIGKKYDIEEWSNKKIFEEGRFNDEYPNECQAYQQAKTASQEAKKAARDFCYAKGTYEAYINGHYHPDLKRWAAFQRGFAGESATSIVDIAARMLNRKIRIMQEDPETLEKKVIYETEFEGEGVRRILYNGHNHFIGLMRIREDMQHEASGIFASKKTEDVIGFLKRKGDGWHNYVGEYGETAMHWAAYRGKEDLISQLHGMGLNVNERDESEGRTPLHWAAKKDHAGAYRLLIELGASDKTKDKVGLTPQDLMTENMVVQFADLLQTPDGGPTTSTPKKGGRVTPSRFSPLASPIRAQPSLLLRQESARKVREAKGGDQSLSTLISELSSQEEEYEDEITSGNYSHVMDLQRLLFRMSERASKTMTFRDLVDGEELSARDRTKKAIAERGVEDVDHIKVHPKGWALCYQTTKPAKAALLSETDAQTLMQNLKRRVWKYLEGGKKFKKGVDVKFKKEKEAEAKKYEEKGESETKDNLPNFVVGNICFIVSDGIHGKHKKYTTISIPVILADGKKAVLSRDSDDGIFLDAQTFWQQVQAQHQKGSRVIKRDYRGALQKLALSLQRTLDALQFLQQDEEHITESTSKRLAAVSAMLDQDGPITREVVEQIKEHVKDEELYRAEVALESETQRDQLFAHSERVFFEAINRQDTIERIYEKLIKELEARKIITKEIEGEEKVKVYSMGLFLESYPNTICAPCSIAAMGIQNSYEEGGFLYNLMERLNHAGSHIKTRGWEDNGKLGDKHKERDPQRFKCLIVAGSSKPFKDAKMKRLLSDPNSHEINFGGRGINIRNFPTDKAFVEKFNSEDVLAKTKSPAKPKTTVGQKGVKEKVIAVELPTICVSGSKERFLKT